MKWPWSRKEGTQTTERKETQSKSACSHPVSHQVQMHEDLKHPDKITSVKCTQCGKTLTPADLGVEG